MKTWIAGNFRVDNLILQVLYSDLSLHIVLLFKSASEMDVNSQKFVNSQYNILLPGDHFIQPQSSKHFEGCQ